MTPLQLIMLLISGFCARWLCVSCNTIGLTPSPGRRQGQSEHFPLAHISYFKDEAALVPGAENRGPRWYDENHELSATSNLHTSSTSDSSMSREQSRSSTTSSELASSRETTEVRRRLRAYRECSPCPMDMILRYTNRGIKWICGQYQRAHRSFKSVCMMRYRNCQDGTMFQKIADHRCPEDTYHGRHWFYVYRV